MEIMLVSKRVLFCVFLNLASADYARFIMCVAVFLLAQVFASLLLTWERRHYQFIQLLLSGLIIIQDIFIILYMSRSVISGNSSPSLCLGLGSVFHLTVVSCIMWYGAISINVFFVFTAAGKLEHFTYQSSRKMRLIYHTVCWSLALIDFIIVWGFVGYGAVQPYSFCWIPNPDILIGAFFAPASLVMVGSVVVTTVVIVQICRVRSFHGKVNAQSVLELISIFVTCCGGLIALVVLGVLLLVFADSPNQVLLLISSLLFLVQALALWVIVFPRSGNMKLWTMLFTCKLQKLQKKNSSLSKLIHQDETAHALKLQSTPSTSPLNSLSGSGGLPKLSSSNSSRLSSLIDEGPVLLM
jgi:hypothetical protein